MKYCIFFINISNTLFYCFVNPRNIWLISHYNHIVWDLDVLQDLSSVVLNPVWRCFPTDIQGIHPGILCQPFGYDPPSRLYLSASCTLLLCAALSQGHLCKICSLGPAWCGGPWPLTILCSRPVVLPRLVPLCCL